jgi:hypothetical protein
LQPAKAPTCMFWRGGPVAVNGRGLPALAAAMVTDDPRLEVVAEGEAELVLVEVSLT